MEYKGYTARIDGEEDGILHGRVDGIRDVVTFEAKDLDAIEREFQISVDVYLDWCTERGREPNRPALERKRAAN